jgi:Tol biopolymer transport system component
MENWLVYSSLALGKQTLWKVSLDGDAPVRINDMFSMFSIYPRISPDGKLIAYYYIAESASPRAGITVMAFEGGPTTRRFDIQLLDGRVLWSPDGTALLYMKSQSGVSNIWSQPISGGPAKQLTDFKTDQIFAFDWSRDGKLACARGTVNNDVVLIRELR